MPESIKYTIFSTKWGYFGLAAGKSGILKTCLPGLGREKIALYLLKNPESAQYDKHLLKAVQEEVIAYFEGTAVNFGLDLPIAMDGLSGFCRSVLTVCRGISFGQTISYGQLAERIGRSGAGRAVGRALAKNPAGLIIPCHRIVRSDGKIGGFSAIGGTGLKAKLIRHEHEIFRLNHASRL